MHLIDEDNGFMVQLVAGTVPLAVEAALASKLKKDGSVAVVYKAMELRRRCCSGSIKLFENICAPNPVCYRK